MTTVKICIVGGAGRVGQFFTSIYREHIREVDVSAIVDTEILIAKEVAKKFEISQKAVFDDLKKAIEKVDFDAVIITTPTFTHADLIKIAADNKKHIFCEKPMALSMQECNIIEKAVKTNNVFFQLGFMRRFDPGFIKAKNLIESGSIGEPIMIKSLSRGPGIPPEWANDSNRSNGMLAEVNAHDFDAVRWLGNSEFNLISVLSHNYKCQDLAVKFPNFYDTVIASFTMENQVMGTIDGVCPSRYGYDSRAEVVGTDGVIFIGSLKSEQVVECVREKGLVSPQFTSWRNRFYYGYVDEQKHFIKSMINNIKPEKLEAKGIKAAGVEDGIKTTEAILAAKKSLEKKIPVYVNEIQFSKS